MFKYHSKIGFNIVVWILVCSSMLTVLLTAGQLLIDYNQNIDKMEQQFTNIELGHHDSFSSAMWSYDQDLIDLQLKGILELPYIEMIVLLRPDEENLVLSTDAAIQYPVVKTVKILRHSNGSSEVMGTLRITADKNIIYQELINSVFYILLSHAVKTFIVSSFILFIIYITIIRRLVSFTQYTRQIFATDPDGPDNIAHPPDLHQDELSELLNAVDQMHHFLVEKIGQLSHKELELFTQATTDALTGIHNRKSISDRVSFMLSVAERHAQQVIFIYIDIDNFKEINDSLGHNAGDEALKLTAERFLRITRKSDTVGRLGGDEFVIVLGDIQEIYGVSVFLDKLMLKFQQPLLLNNQKTSINLSVGVATYPEDGDTCEALLKSADIALYQSKHMGKGRYTFFKPEMNEVLLAKMNIINRLQRAIDNNEFVVHYQPIYSCNDNRFGRLEALVRWNSPDEGMIPPDRFIPIAEENGKINDIGKIVLQQSLCQLKEWRERFGCDFVMAINVSTKQLLDESFAEVLFETIATYDIPPRLVELEITERFLLNHDKPTSDFMAKCKAHGLQLSLDDFGTGYSSLSYLSQFPFDTLKLDRSFTSKLPEHQESNAISLAIIQISHKLGMEVIGEGVETQSQYDFLREHKIDHIQGYYLSKPLSPKAFETWFTRHHNNLRIVKDAKQY